MAIKEVKDDISSEDLEAFEEAQEKGEIKTEETKETKEPKEESTKEVEEAEESEETEETEEEESEEEEVVATKSSKVEIKEVEGETPKERALRLEVTRLRRANRDKEQKDLFNGDKPAISDVSEKLKELGYDEEQIKTLDKAFDIFGESKGFVRKEQSYLAMANEALSNFIDEHSEYSTENDKDDIYWNRFNSILKSDYKLKDKSPKQLKSIFERIDRDVKDELGDNEKVNQKGKIEAQKQKVKSVSSGASASSKKTESKQVIISGNKSFISSNHPNLVFKGFDEDEVDEFTK